MKKLSLKWKTLLSILLSFTYVYARAMPIGNDKRVYTKSHHRKKEIKKLLRRFKGEIIGTTLFVVGGGVCGLAIWKSKQATSLETNHTDHTKIVSGTVDQKLEAQSQNIEPEQSRNIQPLQNDTASSTENHTDSTQTTAQSIEEKLDVEPQNIELDQPQEPQLPQSHITLVEDTLPLALSKKIKEKLQKASKGKEKIKLKKAISLSDQDKKQIEVRFIDDNNIIYHNQSKNLFQYSIIENTLTETTVFEKNKNNNIKYSTIIHPRSDEENEILISGFCKDLTMSVPTDIESLIVKFYARTFMVLIDENEHIITYDIENQILEKIPFPLPNKETIHNVAIDPKGNFIAVLFSTSNEQKAYIAIYNLTTGKFEYRLDIQNYKLSLVQLSFYPSGESLLIRQITAQNNNSIRLWNFKKNEDKLTSLFELGTSVVIQDPQWYSGNKSCVILKVLEGVEIWEIGKKQPQVSLDDKGVYHSTKIHPNEKFLATSGNFGIKIFHIASKKCVFEFSSKAFLQGNVFASLDFSPNGNSMVASWHVSDSIKRVLIFENINAMLDEWLSDNVS